MKIEDLTTEIRPRSAWESIDLGLRMVQTWSRPIILSWLIFVLPICIIIYTVLHEHPIGSIVIIWWLKPLFDKIPLYIISHSVFGDIPTITTIRKVLPALIKSNLIKALFWYRLDPARSFNLPVWQLEGLKSGARSNRARILKKGVYGTAVLLTYFSFFIHCILLAACYLLLTMLLPSNVSSNDLSLFSFSENSILPGLILNIFAVISMSIIEPLYVAGGFALYLNRRIHLEAWDIELKFRSLALRYSGIISGQNSGASRNSKNNNSGIAIVLALVVFACLLNNSGISIISTVEAKAADVNYTELSNQQAQEIVNKAKATDEFNRKVKMQGWFIKDDLFKNLFDDEPTKKREMNFFSKIFAELLYVILIIVVLILIVFLVIKVFKFIPIENLFDSSKKISDKKPKTIVGLDLDPELLPDDIGRDAWLLWQQELYMASLSLLYRGSLSKLVNRDGVKLPASATEGDCIKILKQSHLSDNSALLDYFESLTFIWQRAAYAHQLPKLAEVKKVCDSWGDIFSLKLN